MTEQMTREQMTEAVSEMVQERIDQMIRERMTAIIDEVTHEHVAKIVADAHDKELAETTGTTVR